MIQLSIIATSVVINEAYAVDVAVFSIGRAMMSRMRRVPRAPDKPNPERS